MILLYFHQKDIFEIMLKDIYMNSAISSFGNANSDSQQ